MIETRARSMSDTSSLRIQIVKFEHEVCNNGERKLETDHPG